MQTKLLRHCQWAAHTVAALGGAGEIKNHSFARPHELWPTVHAALGILVARRETTWQFSLKRVTTGTEKNLMVNIFIFWDRPKNLAPQVIFFCLLWENSVCSLNYVYDVDQRRACVKSSGTCLLTQCPEDRGRKIRSSRPARAKTKQNKNSGSTIWPQWVSLKKKKKKTWSWEGVRRWGMDLGGVGEYRQNTLYIWSYVWKNNNIMFFKIRNDVFWLYNTHTLWGIH